MPSSPHSTRRSRVVAALAADVASVIAFAAAGRWSHDGDALTGGGLGLATTAWPFLAALALGWLAARAWRSPAAPLRTGAPVWLVTVAGGMLVRALAGQGTALPFVVVAAVVLLLCLVGWRLAVAAIVRVRERRSRTVEG